MLRILEEDPKVGGVGGDVQVRSSCWLLAVLHLCFIFIYKFRYDIQVVDPTICSSDTPNILQSCNFISS